jgi:hypothetical protein
LLLLLLHLHLLLLECCMQVLAGLLLDSRHAVGIWCRTGDQHSLRHNWRHRGALTPQLVVLLLLMMMLLLLLFVHLQLLTLLLLKLLQHCCLVGQLHVGHAGGGCRGLVAKMHSACAQEDLAASARQC